MSATGRVGVLVMSYGTPAGPDDVEAYYTHIRRGRPPTPEQLDDLRRRYDAIGGVSPLAARTRAQADGVRRALEAGDPGAEWVVEVGSKHAPPFIEDAVEALAGAGVDRAVGLVLAPHDSSMSVGEYVSRVEAAAAATAPSTQWAFVRSWHVEPELVELLATRVRDALADLERAGATAVETLFTAHSLPARVVDSGDPYPGQVAETAAAVAAAAGVGRWRTAWQSAGKTPDPWLGPDILEVIPVLRAEGADGVLVCPVGFTSDHLEVLYDVDVDAARVAAEHGMQLARTASLNDDPQFCGMLARLVRAAVPA